MTEREELEQLFLEKITQDCDGEEHAFSPEYRRNRQRTLNSLRKNAKPLRRLRPFLIIAAAAALTLSIVAASKVFHAPGFTGLRSDDVTKMFSADPGNSPDTLEKLYAVDIPDGFSLQNAVSDSYLVDMMFTDASGAAFDFSQETKSLYCYYFSTENEFERFNVGEYPGVISCSDSMTILAWDIGDYIMQIDSGLPKDDVLRAAQSLHEITENDWNSMMFTDRLKTEISRAYAVDIDGYAAELTAGEHSAATRLSGRDSAMLRQYDSAGWQAWDFSESGFVISAVKLHGEPAWLMYNNAGSYTVYSVLWEFDGYVFETTMNIEPIRNKKGAIDMNLQENVILSLAGKICGCLEMEKG